MMGRGIIQNCSIRATVTMHLLVKLFLLVFIPTFTLAATPEPSPAPSEAARELTVETGLLWQVGTGTPLAYRIVPTQLSWRSKPVFGRELADGSRLIVRHRFTLLTHWVQQGPESRYVGIAASPSLEWWSRNGTWSLYSGAGGGFGWIDARRIRGGQGQDFTLNWFMRGGIERAVSQKGRLSTGILYQHLSNGGQTTPNPGIDALGFTLGYGWIY